MRLIQEKGLEHKFHLIGETTQPENIYPCLDLLCVPSLSEGFPNVIGEAMLCEVPVVATDVGASAQVVGNLGDLVEPGNASSLANSLGEFLSKDKNFILCSTHGALFRISDGFCISGPCFEQTLTKVSVRIIDDKVFIVSL